MRTNEECYEYVLARCGELAAKRRRNRRIALTAAVPVCGVIIAGSVGLHAAKPDVNISSGDVPAVSGVNSEGLSSPVTVDKPVLPKYDNKLNIGEVEIAENAPVYFYDVPGTYEMSRDEVLEHFGLSPELDLSGVVEDLRETAPKNGVLNSGGKHGFCRDNFVDENGNISWGELHPMWDNEEFVFESADGTRYATVFFGHEERIPWYRNNMMCCVGDGSFSNEIFYSLPPSSVAGVEMRIAKRNTGGYYAEFNTGELSVGLSVKGLSEDEVICVLEYLAEYTGASETTAPNDISVGKVEEPTEELIIF